MTASDRSVTHKQAPDHSADSTWPLYSKWDFRGVFLRKYPQLLRALVDPRLAKSDMTDPGTIAAKAAPFADLRSGPEASTATGIPKTVWMLWQQGWDDAPPLVRRCAETWMEHNPGWRIHQLDDVSVRDHVDIGIDLPENSRRPRADLTRIALLAEHGGVWADATLFCTRPLDDWLPAVGRSGFFMFADPRPYRSTDNWFIASEPGGHMIGAMRNMFFQYWRLFRYPHHYFWMHYLIEYLLQRDPVAAEVWARTPKLSALGPLIVLANAFNIHAPKIVFDLLDANDLPVHKLSHKWRHAGSLAGTPVGRLTALEHL